MAVGSKRKRAAAAARTECDKFAHKSSVLLQREAKKVRAFHVRKGVQQLKQTRAQLEQRRSADGGAGDGGAAKLSATVQRLEREHAALKSLDLRAVVQRALHKTGLHKWQQQQRSGAESDDYAGSDDESDGMRRGSDISDDDDGFDSEEYENALRSGAKQHQEDEDDSEDESDDEEQEEEDREASAAVATTQAPDEKKQQQKKKEEADNTKKKNSADEQLQNTLIDRILAHKQMKPLLEAIEKWLENAEREKEKKLRRQEKKALKRDRNEVLIGGRSAAAPSSLFLGSLSGRGDADNLGDDSYGVTSSHMAGAEDDIAEFLGEKKKKNRAGQNARRQKAMRMEEAAKRRQDRANGVFRPYTARRDDSLSKYGLSERPKKKSASEGKGAKRSGDKDPKKRAGKGRERERERGAPAPRNASSAGRGSAAAAKMEVAHPSWIAKQALKEKEKASIGAFSGKKITFD